MRDTFAIIAIAAFFLCLAIWFVFCSTIAEILCFVSMGYIIYYYFTDEKKTPVKTIEYYSTTKR